MLFLLAVFFLNGSAVDAQKAKTVSSTALLYRITGKGLKKPSYIFGTIHLICPNDMFPAEVLKGYIKETSQLLLEIKLDDPEVMKKAAEGAILPAGKSVKDYLKPDEYQRVDELFKNYVGVSYDRFQTFRPNLVSSILLRSPKVIGCQGPVAYDNLLADTATANKIPINGLESVDAEFAAINSEPMEKQVAALSKTAADPEKTFGDFKKLYKLYQTQNADDIYGLTANDSDMDAKLQTKLLNDRNAAWIPVIGKYIKEKPSFIGVGSAHLGGPNGVLNLLRRKGYKLTPIKL